MNALKYIEVNDEVYHIDLEILPSSSILYYILSDEGSIPVKKKHVNYMGHYIEVPYITSDTNIDLRHFKDVVVYLKTGKVSSDMSSEDNMGSFINLLDFLGIFTMKTLDYPIEFIAIKLEEEWDRRNRYNPYFEDIFEDPYLNLIDITDDVARIRRRFKLIGIGTLDIDDSKKFPKDIREKYKDIYEEASDLISSIEKNYGNSVISKINIKPPRRWAYNDTSKPSDCNKIINSEVLEHITKSINEEVGLHLHEPGSQYPHKVLELFWDGHMIVAGGSIISLLRSDITNDIDVFFVGLDTAGIEQRLSDLLAFKSFSSYVSRSANAITIGKLQFILRSYKNVSEVIHGFDIDASGIAFDGTKIYITKRCRHALDNLVNMVDFDRMSPTYEYRLVKYMKQKLFSIYIPDFSIHRARWNRINQILPYDAYGLKGLDYILYNSMSSVKDMKHTSDYEGLNKLIFYNVSSTPRWMKSNNITKITFNIITSFDIEDIIHIPKKIYNSVSISIPQHMTVKVLSPGDQATNTFHVTVLEDTNKWYDGRFYVMKKKQDRS